MRRSTTDASAVEDDDDDSVSSSSSSSSHRGGSARDGDRGADGADEADADRPQLSAHALAALAEVFGEQLQQEQRLACLLRGRGDDRNDGDGDADGTGAGAGVGEPGIDLFAEDWQLSQFWVSALPVAVAAPAAA